MSTKMPAMAAAVVLFFPLLSTGWDDAADTRPPASPASPASSASCAALLDFHGRRYVGHGDLMRTPRTTGRTETATVPGCDDGSGAVPERDVAVQELRDLPMDQAVLYGETVYLPQNEAIPVAARAWFRSPSCRGDGPFTLAGEWLGVTMTHQPRFDGDLRPPYRLQVRVAEGPERYAGTTLHVRVTHRTAPGLTPHDVKSSLWEGGRLRLTAHCDGDTFVADSLSATKG